MSKAFVRDDGTESLPELPERPVSPHPNWVTAKGLAMIEGEVARLQGALAEAQVRNDLPAVAEASRDLRYWTARRASAEAVPPPSGRDKVQFGSTVTVRREERQDATYRIVGEDEAEPSRGTISYVSPLARALLGRAQGEIVDAVGGETEILKIE
ncbi:MAG TPA: transcription elongation factor GreA [Bradyrhizobium sp.]|nr:transcription elongation factor GreA [Bradyrhizobium sp.]